MVVEAPALAELRLVSVFARIFFGSISKTNKTLVDDHVIAEATAGSMHILRVLSSLT